MRFTLGGKGYKQTKRAAYTESENGGSTHRIGTTLVGDNPEARIVHAPDYQSPAINSPQNLASHTPSPGGISTKKRRVPNKDKKADEASHGLDRATFGLKMMYKGGNAQADIVAIHGLNGHRVKTFTADNGVCWLDTLLPALIPDIRVFSYGYDARTHSSLALSPEHLHDHSEQLVQALTSERRMTETTGRPIIFVGHSLGGLIIKSALILSAGFGAGHLEDQKDIKLSTYGILFMGTPHSGGNGVSWGKLAMNIMSIFAHTKGELLRHLGKNSEWAEHQQTQYLGISNHFVTKYFYESSPTPIPGGGSLLVVPKHSACIPGAVDSAKIIIYKDHRNMVRYEDAEDDGFKKLGGTLSIMVKEAAPKVMRNWEEWKRVKMATNTPQVSYSVPMKLPFGENRNFTGRKQELGRIHEVLQAMRSSASGMNIMALHGLGGIGKTQLAVQYAYSYHKDYTSIWWVNGTSTATLSQGYVEIAQRLVDHYAQGGTGVGCSHITATLGLLLGSVGMIGEITDTRDAIKLVKRWLEAGNNRQWLLIVDNYNDIDNVMIRDFLPTGSPGKVLITSRALASSSLGESLEVEEIQREDAIEILRKSAQRNIEDFDKERSDAAAIAMKLGDLPLALDQAGSYIKARGVAFSGYLPRFEAEFARITDKIPAKSAWQYGETVLTTWEMSFEFLTKDAQELLLLCAFFDNEDIWEEILLPQGRLEALGIIQGSVDDAIENIFSLSLAKNKGSEGALWIHPMVHRWSRERGGNNKRKKASEAISLVAAAVSYQEPGRKPENWVLERRLMPHLLACFSHVCQHKYLEHLREDLDFLYNLMILSRTFIEQQRLPEANYLHNWMLIGLEKSLGKEHLDTLNTVHSMALVFRMQGKYKDALQWFRRALDGKEGTLGKEHPNTLTTVNQMAIVFRMQGKYEDALQWYERALKGQEKALGEEHPSTLSTIHDIAVVFQMQGKCSEALEWYKRALIGEEKALGREHPNTLTTVHNMAVVFRMQNKYEEALEWYKRALTGKEKVLGKEHPDTLSTVQNMAVVFRIQGRYKDALEWYKRALTGEEKALGREHPDTLTTVRNMAVVFQKQKKYEDALEWYKRALAGQEKALGRDHPSTKETRDCLMVLERESSCVKDF